MSTHAPNFEHWQSRLGHPGEAVTGFGDIHQGMENVIQTPIGSIPGLPEFGSNHDLFRDLEQVGAAREASVHLHERLSYWCERVIIKSADVTHIEASRARILIIYSLKADVSGQIYTFEFENAFGGVYA